MRRNLLLASAVCLFSLGAMAQDYAPAAWKFSTQEIGSAQGLFIREMAKTDWNASAPFRLADNLDGAIGLTSAAGGDIAIGGKSYADMSEGDKAAFEDFYNSCQIVDGGTLGHIFCYQGNKSTAVDARAVKNPKSMPNSTLFWLSNTDVPLNSNYRLSVSFRVIANGQGKLALTVATSHYDGIDENTGLGDGYRQYDLAFDPAYNEYWATGEMDITIKDNTDPKYKELPLVVKMYLNGIDQAILLLDDIKLEKIDAIDMERVPCKIVDQDWNDAPTGLNYAERDDRAIVWGKDGEITVVDAASPVSVYSISGELVAFKAPMSNLTTIPIKEKGVYIVKVGNSSRKVVL